MKVSYSSGGVNTPKIHKHHGLHHGIDRTQFLGKPLDKPGEHVIRDVIAASSRVYSLLDIGADYFIDDPPASSGRCPVGDETGEERRLGSRPCLKKPSQDAFGPNLPL